MKSKRKVKPQNTKSPTHASKDEYDDDGNNLTEARREAKLEEAIKAEDFRKELKTIGEAQMLLAQLERGVGRLPAGKNKNSSKREIYVDRRLGIFCLVDDEKIFYPKVKPVSQIFKTLLYLVENREPVEITKLASHTKQEPKSVTRSIKAFNKNFRRIFDTKVDPIATNKTGLYYANLEKFEFL